jgi:iron complex transport system substrate-binding protein
VNGTRRAFVALVAAAGLAGALFWGSACSRTPPGGAQNRMASRVVSLSPATTEALFAIGAGSQAVGRSRYCDYPPEALALPVVGGFVDADFEAIVGLGPDLVVGAPGPGSVALADKLARRGVATWFPAIGAMATIQAMITGLGERTGHASQATRLAQALEAQARKVEASVAAEPAPRVLMVAGLSPIVAAGPGSFMDDLLGRARATNVLKEGAPWQTVEFERMLDLDPDVILEGAGGEGRVQPSTPGWAELRAVRTGHVIPVSDPRILRPGPRVAEGLAVLAHALHPNVAAVSFSP